MAQVPAYISVTCPHCNAKQLESSFAKSTFCRKCGKHIDLRKLAAASDETAAGAEEDSGFLDKFTRLFQKEKFRQIRCYHCNAAQTVSSFAKSGSCAQCGGYIDLRDYKITGNFSRTIQTQGSLAIGKRGEVTSTKVVCGSALVLGKLQANVQCSGTMSVKTHGTIRGSIEAKEFIVEKKSDIEFVRPLRAATAEINGKISARIYADSVKISKTGELDGSVHAKSIEIEKGGIFHGDLFIGKPKLEQPDLIPLQTTEPHTGSAATADEDENSSDELDLGNSSVAFSPAT